MAPKQRERRTSALVLTTVGGKRRLRLELVSGASSALQRAALRYFDDDFLAVSGMVVGLPAFIEQARRLEPGFRCSPEALDLILEERDRHRRAELSRQLVLSELPQLVNAQLLPYMQDAVHFIFREGRVLLADEPGLGKITQAVAAIELFKAVNMASSALIVCPTALKYQWAKEIERLVGVQPVIIEGAHDARRTLYSADSQFRIVSYHTLANDIKALGTVKADIVVCDQLQRLSRWNAQIGNAVHRIEADFGIGIMPVLPEDVRNSDVAALMGITREMLSRRFLRRTYADVASQLPDVLAKTVYVPMTKEQRLTHDKCREDVVRLSDKWLRLRFLSEKERERLLRSLADMRKSCMSTALLESAGRSDTKIAEAVQNVADMVRNGYGHAVIFTRWEAVAAMLEAALAREGLYTKVNIVADGCLNARSVVDASLVLNLDVPWDSNIVRWRMSRVNPLPGCRVVTFVSAGSIEESVYDLANSSDGFADMLTDNELAGLILSDSRLDEVCALITRLLPGDYGSPDGALVGRNEQEGADDAALEIPEPSALLSLGTNFLDGLARTLRSPEATARLVEAISVSDDSGREFLHIPMPRTAIMDLLRMLSSCSTAERNME